MLVFSIFNFRPKGKAKCFAGDVGSIGIAFIILFALGQLMENELKMSHVAVSLGFIYLCPATVLAHWIYLLAAALLLAIAYVLFMKKYYRLHEEYLAGVRRG